MKPLTVVLMLLVVLSLAACGSGKSKSDEAKDSVCNARSDISKHVNTLTGLTLSTAALDTAQSSLTAIDNDLKTIKDNTGDLKDPIKSEVQQANQAFMDQLKNIASTLGKTTSLSQARSQATAALQQLGAAYQATLAKVSCS